MFNHFNNNETKSIKRIGKKYISPDRLKNNNIKETDTPRFDNNIKKSISDKIQDVIDKHNYSYNNDIEYNNKHEILEDLRYNRSKEYSFIPAPKLKNDDDNRKVEYFLNESITPLIEEFEKQEPIKEKDDIQLNTLTSNYANLAQN